MIKITPSTVFNVIGYDARLLMLSFLLMSSVPSCCPGLKLPSESSSAKDSTVVNYRDSVRIIEKVNVRDSVVFVPVPAESSQSALPVSAPSHLETSYAVSDAWVDSLGLHHTLANKDVSHSVHVPVIDRTLISELQRLVDKQQQLKESQIKTEYVEVEKPLSWWKKFKIGAFWWLCAAVVGLLLWTFRKIIFRI